MFKSQRIESQMPKEDSTKWDSVNTNQDKPFTPDLQDLTKYLKILNLSTPTLANRWEMPKLKELKWILWLLLHKIDLKEIPIHFNIPNIIIMFINPNLKNLKNHYQLETKYNLMLINNQKNLDLLNTLC